MIRLRHGRVPVALHPLRDGEGPALLLLHGWRGSSGDWGEAPALWHGPVWALDFTGHGRSGRLRGHAYYPEYFAGDADVALSHVGPARLAGIGIGAYIALLLAGARPERVRGALLLPGRGLEGGGDQPDFAVPQPALRTPVRDAPPRTERGGDCDPWLPEIASDLRPPSYARAFADAAPRLLLAEDGAPRPGWWVAIREARSAERAPVDLHRALRQLADG
jgi:pimeloyl-ACP methyl ester carboxylesterase